MPRTVTRHKYGAIVRELMLAADDALNASTLHYAAVDAEAQPMAELVAEKQLTAAALTHATNAERALEDRLHALEIDIRRRQAAENHPATRRPTHRKAPRK